MTSKKLSFGMLVLVFGMMFTSCQQEVDDDPSYTIAVWTDSETYAEFNSWSNLTLNDGYYIRVEITNDEFNGLSLPDEYKHQWTESQIYNWFIGRGFGNAEANQEKAWLMTVNHGAIVSRSGNIVYELIK
jgi:hypothetical protein